MVLGSSGSLSPIVGPRPVLGGNALLDAKERGAGYIGFNGFVVSSGAIRGPFGIGRAGIPAKIVLMALVECRAAAASPIWGHLLNTRFGVHVIFLPRPPAGQLRYPAGEWIVSYQVPLLGLYSEVRDPGSFLRAACL